MHLRLRVLLRASTRVRACTRETGEVVVCHALCLNVRQYEDDAYL